MKKNEFYLLFFSLTLSPQIVSADSFWDQTVLVGGLEVGHKSQKLGELLDNRLSFYTISGNLQMTYNDFYLGLNIANSLGDTDISEDGEVGSAERSDIDVVFGWQIRNDVTVFAGYKQGETRLDLLTREDEDSTDPQIPFRNTFEEKGPYIGVAYTHRLSRAGQLTYSLAYARLDGENSLENANADPAQPANELDFDDLQGVFKNSAEGYSVGMKWSLPVADDIYYTSLLRMNRYQQDIAGDIGSAFKSFSVDETFIDISIGFVYLF